MAGTVGTGVTTIQNIMSTQSLTELLSKSDEDACKPNNDLFTSLPASKKLMEHVYSIRRPALY